MKQVLVLVGVPVIVLTALAVWLFGRSGGSDPAPAAPVAHSPAYTPVGMASPNDCKLAVLDWADAAESVREAAVFGSVPDEVDEAALKATLNRIKTYCFPKAADTAAGINYRLALAVAQAHVAGGLSTKRALRLSADISMLKSDLTG